MAVRRRVWIVSELFYPEETSTGHVMTGIAEALARDFDVRVATIQPTYSSRGLRAPRIEIHNGVTIHRCRSTTFDRKVLLLRLINIVTIAASIFVNVLLRLQRDDLVLVVTNPPSLPFAVAGACRLRGARCVLLVHDVFPDVLVAVGITRPDSVLARTLRVATGWLYRSVSDVVAIGRDMQSLVRSKRGDCRVPVQCIPNWADEEIEPRARVESQLLREKELENSFVIEYAGNIGAPNDFETLLGGAEGLTKYGDIRFLILGSGSREDWLRAEIKRRGLSNVLLVGSRPRSQQSDFLAAADLAVISLRRGMIGVSVPSRTYNTMASQRPILAICEPGSELWMMIHEERMGWAVSPGDIDGAIEAILQARRDPALRVELGIRARRAAVTRYSRAVILDMWRDLFVELDAENGR